MDLQIRGKRAFVSGSSSGIGKSIALELAKEGCDVVVHGRDKARTEETAHQVEALGVQGVVTIGDLATESGCEKVAKEALAGLGAIDIVVNNAGVVLRKDDPPWSEIPLQTYVDSMEINFYSALRMSMHFLPGIKKSGWGRFVNISTSGATMTPCMIEYTSAKAALNKLTADIAKDVGQYGATANAISPGIILTPAVAEWLEMTAKEENWPGEFADWEIKYCKDLEPWRAIPTFARPEDVAAMAAFLASTRAGHISGAIIRVDSGHTRALYV